MGWEDDVRKIIEDKDFHNDEEKEKFCQEMQAALGAMMSRYREYLGPLIADESGQWDGARPIFLTPIMLHVVDSLQLAFLVAGETMPHLSAAILDALASLTRGAEKQIE